MDIVDEAKELTPWLDENHLVARMAKHIEYLRLQNEQLRQTNKLLSDLFHEAVALPQGACPRPATAGDGMFNPHHRALNKPTGGK